MIARFLARCVDSWTALVPTLAASGATLVTLGSHEIITQREVNYRDLVEYFPAHEFAIDIAEAGDDLKFNVSEPDRKIEDIFDDLRPELERSRAYIGLVPSNPASRS